MLITRAQEAVDLGRRVEKYLTFRQEYPRLAAVVAYRAARIYEDGEVSAKEAICFATGGHEWAYTGTQYGGDDERWGGEGRCYCMKCGADGDG